MKIIGRNNFDSEMLDEILVAENVDVRYIDDIVEMLNEKYCNSECNRYYFETKPDYYILYEFKP